VYCQKCGKENADEAIYCAYCGELLKEPLLSRKGKVLMIITGCFILLLLGLSVLVGTGGLYYYFFYQKKPAQKGVQETTAAKKSSSATEALSGKRAGDETTEALVRKTVEKFYTALMDGKFEEAGRYVTARAKGDWFSPEIQGQGDAQLTDFQINLVTRVKDSVYKVAVKETYEDFEGKFYQTLSYFLLKKGNEWLIDDVKFVGEIFDIKPDVAINTVGEFLNAIKEERMGEARGMVTEGFIREQGEDFFTRLDPNLFQQFEVLKAEKEGDYYWVYTREVWNSGPENMKYKVIATEGGIFIDSMTWAE
jgi:hypothetical protein